MVRWWYKGGMAEKEMSVVTVSGDDKIQVEIMSGGEGREEEKVTEDEEVKDSSRQGIRWLIQMKGEITKNDDRRGRHEAGAQVFNE